MNNPNNTTTSNSKRSTTQPNSDHGRTYAARLEQGREFQDYVSRALYPHGIVINGYASCKYQYIHGENILGAEIKRDGNFRRTGNLYFEVGEKSHPNNPAYVTSGIHRDDNSWLFIIGDEQTLWMFAVNWLRKLERRYKRVRTPTSIGFLMPISEADKYCARRFDLSGGEA